MSPQTHPKHLPVIPLILFGIIHLLLIYHYTLRTLTDTLLYTTAANYLATHGHLAEADQIFYSIPIACLAASGFLWPDTQIPYIVLQCIIAAAAVIALYRAASIAFEDNRAGLWAAVIGLLWWDMVQWNITVMTESLAGSFSCFLLYSLVIFKARNSDYCRIALWTTACILTRPTGIIMVLGVLAFMAVYHRHSIHITKWRIIGMSILTLSVLIAAAAYMFSHWDFTDQYKRGNIITYADTMQGTAMYHTSMQLRDPVTMPPAETTGLLRIIQFVIQNPMYMLKAMLLKIGFLLSGVRPYYSTAHNAYAAAWNLFIYIAACWGLKALVKPQLRAYVFMVIIINIAIVGFSAVDWDNRFFMPMVPAFTSLAGAGVARWMKQFG